jgi:Predicted periplasmic solute-binding protein
VAYNRLEQGLPLQFDSTVNYALGTSTLLVTEDMLDVDSPYNTYRVTGLPPTPINSPGQEAIEAALNPEAGDWLYFVTVDPRTLETRFTASYEEFLVFKAEFQKNYELMMQGEPAQPTPEPEMP